MKVYEKVYSTERPNEVEVDELHIYIHSNIVEATEEEKLSMGVRADSTLYSFKTTEYGKDEYIHTFHNHDERYYTEKEIDNKLSTINTNMGLYYDYAVEDAESYTNSAISTYKKEVTTALNGKSDSDHEHGEYYTRETVDSKLKNIDYSTILNTPTSLPPTFMVDEYPEDVETIVSSLKFADTYEIQNNIKLIPDAKYRIISNIFGIDGIYTANSVPMSNTTTITCGKSTQEKHIWFYSYSNGNFKVVRGEYGSDSEGFLPDFDFQIYRIIDAPGLDTRQPVGDSDNLITSGAVDFAFQSLAQYIARVEARVEALE